MAFHLHVSELTLLPLTPVEGRSVLEGWVGMLGPSVCRVYGCWGPIGQAQRPNLNTDLLHGSFSTAWHSRAFPPPLPRGVLPHPAVGGKSQEHLLRAVLPLLRLQLLRSSQFLEPFLSHLSFYPPLPALLTPNPDPAGPSGLIPVLCPEAPLPPWPDTSKVNALCT